MRFRPLQWLLLCLATSVSVAEELSLSELTTRLAHNLQQRSSFVQLKTVAGLSRPLRSTGEVLVVRDQGVLYTLLKPLPARYGIGRNTLILEEAGQRRELQASDAPWLRTLGRLLHSILAGELSALEQDFRCELVAMPDGWQLTLTPLREPLSLALQQVQLVGDKQINTVQILDRSSDKTELQFQPLPAQAIRSDEQLLLDRLK